MASGFITNEPQVGPRSADCPLRSPCGAVWCLEPGPLRTGGRDRQPARGHRGFRGRVRPGSLRLLVPAQDEDTPMKRLAHRILTAAAIVIGGGSSVLACPVCFGAEETPLISGTKLGVLVMVLITFAVQGAFVAFFLYLRNHAKRMAETE